MTVRRLGFLGVRVGDPARFAATVSLLWETQRDGAIAWAHVRGPDGAVYELIESTKA